MTFNFTDKIYPHKNIVRWTLICAVLWGITHNAQGSDEAPIVEKNRPSAAAPLQVAYTEFAPASYTNEYGIPQGYFIDLIKSLLEEIQQPYTLISKPTARIYHQLKTGEVDLWLGVQGVPSIQKHTLEVTLPEQYSISLSFWRKAGTPDFIDIQELQNKSIAVINGFTYAGLIDEITAPHINAQIARTSNHSNAFKMLISNRVNYLLDYEQPVQTLLKEYPSIKILNRRVQHKQLGIIISRHPKYSLKIFKALSRAVEQRHPTQKKKMVINRRRR